MTDIFSCLYSLSFHSFTVFFFFFFKHYLFIYFWLRTVFLAVHGLSPVAVSGVEWGATLRRSAQASHCSGFSCCGARVGEQASVVAAQA